MLNVPKLDGTGGARTIPVALDSRDPGGETVGFTFPALRAEHYRLIVSILHQGSDTLSTFRSQRRQKKSILGGIFGFVRWGTTEPWRGFRSLSQHLAAARRNRRPQPGRLPDAGVVVPSAPLIEASVAKREPVPFAMAVGQ